MTNIGTIVFSKSEIFTEKKLILKTISNQDYYLYIKIDNEKE